MPQPIDPNTELGRVTAAERIQQATERAALAAQARQSAESDRERLSAEQQVREMRQKSEEVDSELKRRNPYAGRRKKGKQEQRRDGGRRTRGDDGEEHQLDVTV